MSKRIGAWFIVCILCAAQPAIASDRFLTCFVPPPDGETVGDGLDVLPINDRGAIIGSNRGLFYFNAISGQVDTLVSELKGVIVTIGAPKPGNMMPEITGNEPVGHDSTGRVTAMISYTNGRYLIGAENGVFLWSRGVPLRRLAAAETTGLVNRLDLLANDAVLVMTDRGWFRLDKNFNQSPIGNAQIGDWVDTYALEDGSALILGFNGWFHFNPINGEMSPAGPDQVGDIQATFALNNGNFLVGGENGAFYYNATTHAFKPIGGPGPGAVSSIDMINDGSVIFESDHGLYRFDTKLNALSPIAQLPEGAITWVLPRGEALVHASGEWSLLNLTTGQSLKTDEPDTGRVHEAVQMNNGSWLLQADKGWFTLASRASTIRAAGTFEPGSLGYIALELTHGTDGSELFSNRAGFFRFDPQTSTVVPAGQPDIGYVDHDRYRRIFPLPHGLFLIHTRLGWFSFDPILKIAMPAGLPRDLGISRIWNVGDTAIALGTGLPRHYEQTLLTMPTQAMAVVDVSPLTKLSSLTLQPQVSQQVDFTLKGRCAPAIAELGLTLAVTINGMAQPVVPVRLKDGTQPSLDEAQLSASLVVDRIGSWSLRLRQQDIDVGPRMTFRMHGPIDWKIVSYAVTAFLAAVFAILLFLTHYYAWAFRLISDNVWAKFATWPFFFLRHVGIVQLWMMEPWFRAVRAATPVSAPFIDPPVLSGDGKRLVGTDLLTLLVPKSRIWLQGRSGMGKSAVFGAWMRSYFAPTSTLSLLATKRKFGCVVIPLNIRNYAMVNPPETTRPESWIIEIVRRQLEEFGFATRDRDLVEAMLSSGQFALLLDGANEADCDLALSAFARQFARVRLIVTSQAAGEDGWSVWRLPENVLEMRESLLCLWLGVDAGKALADRIMSQGLSDTLVSGYDLRLVADLAAADPGLESLPHDRNALYRKMIGPASTLDGEPFDLPTLEFLAWTMVIGRRRDLRAADEETIGPRALARLTFSGILRQIGTAYEFRHDQMRAFLASLWLVEEVPSIDAMEQMIVTSGVLSLSRREQEDFWAFFVQTLPQDVSFQRLWRFANETPVDRIHLIAALKTEAKRRSVPLIFEA